MKNDGTTKLMAFFIKAGSKMKRTKNWKKESKNWKREP